MTRCEAFLLAYQSSTIEGFEIAIERFREPVVRNREAAILTPQFQSTPENRETYFRLAHLSLQEVRNALGLSQGSLAREVGFTAHAVACWESKPTSSSYRELPGTTMFHILEHFGLLR